MDDQRFKQYVDCVSEAFQKVVFEIVGIEFNKGTEATINDDRKFSVVVGITGKNRGMIHMEAGNSVIKSISEAMYDGPVNNIMDTYLCVAEFSNMLSGNAVTLINNIFRGSDLRLTPPAVFAGVGMEVTTPAIQSSTSTFFSSEIGTVIINIGFEGE